MAKPKASTEKLKSSLPPTSSDDWVELSVDRYMWSFEEGSVLQGYLLSTEHIEPKNGRPFAALVVRTTVPVMVTNRDDELIEAEVGTEILVPVTHKLTSLTNIAEHPQLVYEVRIQALKKVDIGGGQTMWTFKVAARKQPKPRDDFGPMFSAYDAPPALPESNGADISFPAQ